jgi:PKD repeat protein
MAVTVDAVGRIYVADQWGARVQVFDSSAAYLTTIGGISGSRTGELFDAHDLAIDTAGNLYTADAENHRIQKFALGVPGWLQSNINGFGDRQNSFITSLAPFGGYLYAGTYNGNGAQLWRKSDGGDWTAVITGGFGSSYNAGIDHLIEFNGYLYAGTWADEVNGGEVWRSSDGLNWTRIVRQGFGVPTNGEVFRFAVFDDTLYATTWSYTTDHGAEIWRSSTGIAGDWTRVVTNGFGDANNQIVAMEVFNGYLYAGTYNWNSIAITSTGGEVWRTNDGTTWTQVNADGFGSTDNLIVSSFAVFNDYLYAGIDNWNFTARSSTGAQAWRCQVCDGSDWQQVMGNGFGNPRTHGMSALEVFDNHLYFVVANSTTGMEVWRTVDGTNWEQVGFAGFGDSNNYASYWDNAVAVFNNYLYIGANNRANGGEVWRKSVVTAAFTASPTAGVPPLTVTFTNTSTGDYTSSLWGFGDGITSTLTSPTHTYTAAGVYTVTLTVSDGIDTSTITRPNHITVRYSVYLPLILRNY